MNAYCLFEQSGTFKNAFKEFGFNAYDADILNDFGETDFVRDIFADIEIAHTALFYNGAGFEKTLFSQISSDDLVFAFFPCTRFTEKTSLNSRCELANMQSKGLDSDFAKLSYSNKIIDEVHKNYTLLCKLCQIALQQGFKMIVENPNSVNPNFLRMYFPLKPAVSIQDRSKYGDYYKKPTNFWFLNCKPKFNFIFENIENSKPFCVHRGKKVADKISLQVARSLMSPVFARRFIKELRKCWAMIGKSILTLTLNKF